MSPQPNSSGALVEYILGSPEVKKVQNLLPKAVKSQIIRATVDCLLRQDPAELELLLRPLRIPDTSNHVPLKKCFRHPDDLCGWKPDSLLSQHDASDPVCLCFHNAELFKEVDLEGIRSFETLKVQQLAVSFTEIPYVTSPLSPFQAISPTVKSLKVTWSSPQLEQLFEFIGSFPSLEDLYIKGSGDCVAEGSGRVGSPGISQSIKVTLELGDWLTMMCEDFIRRLEQVGTLRLEKLVLKFQGGIRLQSVNALVKKYSGTLEYLDVPLTLNDPARCGGASLDLSSATRLKELRVGSPYHREISPIYELNNIGSKDLERISIRLAFNCNQILSGCSTPINKPPWSALDSTLYNFWLRRNKIYPKGKKYRLEFIWYANKKDQDQVTDDEMDRFLKGFLPRTIGEQGVEFEVVRRDWTYDEPVSGMAWC